MRPRVFAIPASALAIGGTLWFALPAALRSMPVFAVRRVEVVGTHYLEPEAIVKRLALERSASIFDSVEPLERRAFSMIGVGRVAIGRRLPGTLVVTVEERPPVGLTEADGQLRLVDRRGQLLPYDPTRGFPDLPLTEPDPAVLGVVEKIRDDDPPLFARVVSARRDGSTVVVEIDAYRLLFRVGATSVDVRRLAIVLSEVERRNLRVAELDVRFDGRVIVRRRI